MRTRSAMDKNSVSESQGLGSIPSGAAFVHAPLAWQRAADSKNWLRRTSSATQRSLHSIQAHVPTTASSAQFCLLCCQPEPIPRSLAARMSQLTSRDPCRLQAWLGRAFGTVCRTCAVSPHSLAIVPKATGDRSPPVPKEGAGTLVECT